MITFLYYFNLLLACGAVLLQIACVVSLAILVWKRDASNALLSFIQNNFLAIGFVLSFVATLSSLFYSDVIGFVPCKLCWLQRICMYPLVVLFGLGWWKKDREVLGYALQFTVIGILIAIHHNYIYIFGENYPAPCDASGVSCVKKLVSVFGGYITIPSLALTSFVGILTALVVAFFYQRRNNRVSRN